jgi:hypothetical protein
MGLLLTFVAGLVIWIVLWSLGAKSLDAIMLTLLMVLVAAGARILKPFLPGNRPDADAPSGGSWTPR